MAALALVLFVAIVALKDDIGVEADLLDAGAGCVGRSTGHVIVLFRGKVDEGTDGPGLLHGSTARVRAAWACHLVRIWARASSLPSVSRSAFSLSRRACRPSMADVPPELPHPAHPWPCTFLPLASDSGTNIMGTRTQRLNVAEPLSPARRNLNPARA